MVSKGGSGATVASDHFPKASWIGLRFLCLFQVRVTGHDIRGLVLGPLPAPWVCVGLELSGQGGQGEQMPGGRGDEGSGACRLGHPGGSWVCASGTQESDLGLELLIWVLGGK